MEVERVEAMVARLRHRGPDHQAVLAVDEHAVLGHARLSIIDLSPLGHQPMQDASGRYTITYNGEVYNFRALRRELEAGGYRFVSNSDTEVVLASWATWGADAVRRLDGMFAFAIWDARDRQLVLARDRFGEKPLYYTFIDGAVTFASELPAIVAALRSAPPVSLAALNQYLAIGYTLSPLSIYEGVHKLEPATYLVIRDGSVVARERYWDYRAHFARPTRENERDIERHLETLLDGAIEKMLVSDVPVGSFLSGGIDSSGVVALARRHVSYDLHTFSAGFAQRSYDESADARLVADAVGTIHHACRIERDTGRALADSAIDCYGEPFSDTSLVPMVAVARLAAKHVKVSLSGDGADEIFAGYLTYRADALHHRLRVIPSSLRAAAAALTRRIVGDTRRKVGFAFKAKQFANGIACDERMAHYRWRELHTQEERIAILGREHADLVRETDPSRTFLQHYAEATDLPPLARHLYVDAKTWLVDDVLVKVDRATMASSLESRIPFLDRALVEYAATIPPELKLRGSRQKIILKRVFARYLPAATLAKPKAGFNAPINSWFDNREDNEFRFFNRYVLSRWRSRREPA